MGPKKNVAGTKRARTMERGEASRAVMVAQEDVPQPRRTSSKIKGTGGIPKTKIHAGLVIDDDMEGCMMMNLLREIDDSMLNFFKIEEKVCPNLVNYFYNNVKISCANPASIKFRLKIHVHTHVYGLTDFMSDFGIGTNRNGIAYYQPSDIQDSESYVDNIMKFNKGKFPPGWDSESTKKTVLKNGKSHTKTVEGHCPYLTGEEYLVFKVVRDGIFPSGNKSQNPTNTELMIFTKLLEKKKLNLPFLIASHMQFSIATKRGSTLPYGAFVTHIMRRFGGIRGVEEQGKNIRYARISRSSCKYFGLTFENGQYLSKLERYARGINRAG